MSKCSLLFSIEQWEFVRRLRNSGLNKEQVCQAFDELDRVEREFGNLFANVFGTNGLTSPLLPSSLFTNEQLNILQQQFKNDPTQLSKALMQNLPLFMALNFQKLLIGQVTNNSSLLTQQQSTPIITTTVNSSATTSLSPSSNPPSTSSSPIPTVNINNINNNNNNNNKDLASTNKCNSNDAATNTNATTTISNSNTFIKSSIHDIEDEIKELEEFRLKGDHNIHYEISHFVYKYDLKQSQIARMAGVNQAYVSKFLRGDFSDLSENGKTLIYKWYLKFTKNPMLLARQNGLICNSSSTDSDQVSSTPTFTTKAIKLENGSYSYFNMINTYEAPKRTRFSFKPDHLTILEKSFLENPYPDPKKREELAKLCNSMRATSEISDRERVTEQIVTHWFQNKRKLTRRVNLDDSVMSNYNEHSLTTSPIPSNHDENNNSYDQLNCNNSNNSTNNENQSNSVNVNSMINNGTTSYDYDAADDSPINCQDFMDEAQLAAYKTIMSQMNNSIANSSNNNENLNNKLKTELI